MKSDILNAVLRLPSGFISIFDLAVNLKNREPDITIDEALDILGRNVFSRASSSDDLENLPRLIDWETKQSVGFMRWAAARLAIATFGIDAIKGKDLNEVLVDTGFDAAEVAAYLKREANIYLDVDGVINSPKSSSTEATIESDVVTDGKAVTQNHGADATTPIEQLATRDELIAAFGAFTGMNGAWFENLLDKPALREARKVIGVGGRNPKPALFCPFAVMTWLINPKRRTGKPLSEATGWRLLKHHFNDAYVRHEGLSPLDH